jgi:tRNA1Val (adenine37-N6)-methyltransferase
MTDIVLNPGERIDQLQAQRIQIIQNPDMFAFSLDAVLLAHFAGVSKKGHGLTVDLGAGTGAIGLLYARKVLGQVRLIEIQQDLARMAERSVQLNQLADRVKVIHTDMQQVFEHLAPNSAETVLTNPPYFPLGEINRQNDDEHYRIARHEITVDLAGVVKVGAKLLKSGGKFYMVHRPERLMEIMTVLAQRKLMVKRVQFVYGKPGREANMVLIEAIKAGKPGGVRILPALIAYQTDNTYTPEVHEILYGAPWS